MARKRFRVKDVSNGTTIPAGLALDAEVEKLAICNDYMKDFKTFCLIELDQSIGIFENNVKTNLQGQNGVSTPEHQDSPQDI